MFQDNTVRCSEIDRILDCPGSLIPPRYPVNYESAIASQGTALHRVMQGLVEGRGPVEVLVEDELARDDSLNQGDMNFLAGEGARAWQALEQTLPANRKAEVMLRSDRTRGVADVLAWDDNEAVVLDWKFGYNDELHPGQLTGYAAGAMASLEAPPETVRCVEVLVRHGRWHTMTVARDDVEQLHRDLARYMAKPDARWAPGKACKFCPSRHECGAREAWLRSSAWLVEEGVSKGSAREVVAHLYDRAGDVKNAASDYFGILNSVLEDGPLKLSGGRVAELSETRREEINLAAAWPFLKEVGLTADDLLSATRITKTALRRTLMDKAPKGSKGAFADGVLLRLSRNRCTQTSLKPTRRVRSEG